MSSFDSNWPAKWDMDFFMGDFEGTYFIIKSFFTIWESLKFNL